MVARERVPGGEDATATDRRTLIVGAVAMFGLIAVGVVSSAVFARSACVAIDPAPVAARAAADDVGAVLGSAFADVDDATREAMVDAIDGMAAELGPVTGIAEVTGARHAVAAADDGIAVTGPVTTLLGAHGATVRATADVDEGRVVGSGDTLYSLALVNELTGQVDALQPLDGELAGLTCVDTATVGTPLAFHLDAGDGQLLLLRVGEDGDDPDLELRDPVAGRVWAARLELGVAPAGLQGQRLTARLGPDVVLAGHRTEPGDTLDVLTAVERRDGAARWSVARDQLAGILDGERADVVEVLDVGEAIALVLVAPEAGDEIAPGGFAADVPMHLLAVDVADGGTVWEHSLDPGSAVRDVEVDGERAWLALEAAEAGMTIEVFDAGGRETIAGADRSDPRLSLLGEQAAVVVADGVMLLLDGDADAITVSSPFVGRDVVAHDAGVTLLLDRPGSGAGSPDPAVAVTFAG